jgi:hypothetical protein
MRHLYLVVMAALLCIGCGRATFDESDLWKTVNLKSKSEVKSILGRPDAVRPKNRFGEGGGAWVYRGLILDKASGRRMGAVINFHGDKAFGVDAF